MGSLLRLSLETPMFREQLIRIRALRTQIGEDYPLILTLFSPPVYAFRFMDKQRETGALTPQKAPHFSLQRAGIISSVDGER